MHIKRLTAPKAWHIKRKEGRFVIRPLPSGHPKSHSVPLVVLLRDILKIVKDVKETKVVASKGLISVDGVVRKNPKFSVGLMDVVGISSSKKFYRISLDEKGKIKPVHIADAEKKKKICRIKGKRHVRGGKLQYGLHDGRTILVKTKADSKFKVNESLLIQLPDQKILKHLPLESGMSVLIISGKHAGVIGTIEDVGSRGDVNIKSEDGKFFETPVEYLLVIGKKKPELKVR